MDMLLIGAVSQGRDGGTPGKRCVTIEEEQTQMASQPTMYMYVCYKFIFI